MDENVSEKTVEVGKVIETSVNVEKKISNEIFKDETIKTEENIDSSSLLDPIKSTAFLTKKVGSIINELDYNATEVKLEKNFNDDGEIVSDSEINIKNDTEKKLNRKRELDNSDNNDDEPNIKKSALDHLRSMKFAKRDPFGDSLKLENSKGLSFNRVDHSPVYNSLLNDTTSVHSSSGNSSSKNNYENRKKRFQGDDDRRHRYRRNDVSPSQDDVNQSNEIQQKRQRSTMYLLRQKDSQNNSSTTSNFQHQQLPGLLKNILPVNGSIRHKMDSILALSDEQVYSLPALELRSLLLYTVEVSLEQDRFLTGRKAQLKELYQMIQKEKDLIEKIVNDMPASMRPNLSELFESNEGNTTQNINQFSSNGSLLHGTSGFNMPPPIFNTEPQQKFSQHQSLPIDTGNDFRHPPSLLRQSEDFSSDSLNSSTNNQVVSGAGNIHFTTSTLPSGTVGLPPPIHAVADLFASSSNIISTAKSSNNSQVSNLTAPLPNFSAPPPNLITTVPNLPNLSAPPPNIPSLNITAPPLNLSVPPPNLSAPPPIVNFNIPPPSIIPSAALLASHSSSPSANREENSLKSSNSSTNLNNITCSNLPGTSINDNILPDFSVPPPGISKNSLLPSTINSTLSTTNITTSLDLLIPPSQINQSIINNNLNSNILPNLSQPPLIVSQQNIVSTKNLIPPVTIQSTVISTVNSISTNSQISSNFSFLQQQQQSTQFSSTASNSNVTNGLVSLMSIEHTHPSGFLGNRKNNNNSNIATGIRSLVSLVSRKQQNGKRNQKKRQRLRQAENKAVDNSQNKESSLEFNLNEKDTLNNIQNTDSTIEKNKQSENATNDNNVVQSSRSIHSETSCEISSQSSVNEIHKTTSTPMESQDLA